LVKHCRSFLAGMQPITFDDITLCAFLFFACVVVFLVACAVVLRAEVSHLA
jgi:hypothetical protein